MTVAVLDGDSYYHQDIIHGEPFRHRFDRSIYAPDLDDGVLRALFVADRVSPTVLRAKRRIMHAFLRGGGTLIVLGENQAHTWAPGVEWTFRPTNFWWWLEKDADPGHRIAEPDHELFRYIAPTDVIWHLHGLHHPPAGAFSTGTSIGPTRHTGNRIADTHEAVLAPVAAPFVRRRLRPGSDCVALVAEFLQRRRIGAVPVIGRRRDALSKIPAAA